MSAAPERATSEAGAGATAAGLATAAAIAFAHALWTLFQWTQLVSARTGGDSFCGLGEGGQCQALWDAPMASAVQSWTGVPVAGWGLVWSLAAFALPLLELVRRAGGRAPAAAWPATLVLAWAGVGTVVLLLGSSLLTGMICTTCAATYVLVVAYAVVCVMQERGLGAGLLGASPLAATAAAVAFLVLLWPGLRTPPSKSAEEQRVMDQIARKAEQARTPEAAAERRAVAAAPGSRSPEEQVVDASLRQLIEQLSPEIAQAFADELHAYANAPKVIVREPRALIGHADAPVHITEFTDSLCSHCANLHETLARLKTTVPLRTFSVESRQFPLDPACNPELPGESRNPVRCTAARALICMEGQPEAFDFAGTLYLHQRVLDEARIYEAARGILSREALAACMSDTATEAKLRSDIEWAMEHDIQGTPMVLINGRRVAAFGPLLYALILTGGSPEHPAFAKLPAPST